MSLQQYIKVSSGAIRESAKAMHKKLIQYYNKTSEVICICAVLDPNRKLNDFQDDSGSAYAEQTWCQTKRIYILYEKNIELIALFTKKNPY